MSLIKLENVTMDIPIIDPSRSIRTSLVSRYTGGRISRGDNNEVTVRALENVSFSLEDGERLALIGHNGSGKTTLLRLLAGIYWPTSGLISVNGRITPMFNPSLGMDMDDTGFDNIYNIGLFFRMTTDEINEKIDDIAEFCELGEFLSLPVRTYSSGMLVRLAFAVATAVDPEILLIEEGIGAGDARFAERAEERINSFYSKLNVLVIASHSEALIRQLCTKALLLEHGNAIVYGDIDEVLYTYKQRTGGELEKTIVSQLRSTTHEGMYVEIDSLEPLVELQDFSSETRIGGRRVGVFGDPLTSGKWYWEFQSKNLGMFNGQISDTSIVGVLPSTDVFEEAYRKEISKSTQFGSDYSEQNGSDENGDGPDSTKLQNSDDAANKPESLAGWGWCCDGTKVKGEAKQPFGERVSKNDSVVLRLALDMDERKLWVGVDDEWIDGSDPGEGRKPIFDNLLSEVLPAAVVSHGLHGSAVLQFVFSAAAITYDPPPGFSFLKASESLEGRPTILGKNRINSDNVEVLKPNKLFVNYLGISTQRLGAAQKCLRNGKWYWEIHSENLGWCDGKIAPTAMIGLMTELGDGHAQAIGWRANGIVSDGDEDRPVDPAPQTLDTVVVMVAFDADEGKLWIGCNGNWLNDGAPSDNVSPLISELCSKSSYKPMVSVFHAADGIAALELKCEKADLSYERPLGFSLLKLAETS